MLRPYDARVLRAYDARPQLRLGARDSIANDHDSVYVIGHYDERIEGDARLMIRDRVPRPAHRVTKLRQSQASLGDFGKQSTSLMSADGDEVRATAPIVVGWKAIRPSADAAAAEAGAIGGAGHAGE